MINEIVTLDMVYIPHPFLVDQLHVRLPVLLIYVNAHEVQPNELVAILPIYIRDEIN